MTRRPPWKALAPIAFGSVSNDIVSGHDWLPTFLAAAGMPDIKEKLLTGHEVSGTTFKVHLDGYNLLSYLTGQTEQSPREGFFYFNDDADLVALRNAPPEPFASGPNPSPRSASPRFLTSALTPMNALMSPRIQTMTGCSPRPT
jgi:hypothetical protein